MESQNLLQDYWYEKHKMQYIQKMADFDLAAMYVSIFCCIQRFVFLCDYST